MTYYDSIKPRLTPYIHQQRIVPEIVDSLLSCGFRAEFMEMATGKTKVTLDAVMVLHKMGKVDGLVVIAPKSVCREWVPGTAIHVFRDIMSSDMTQCEKHLTIPFNSYLWDGKSTAKSDEEFSHFLAAPGFSVMAVNIEAFMTVPDAMRIRLRTFMKSRKVVIAQDESSKIKNSEAYCTKNVTLARSYAIGALIMTGTEIGRSIVDLYSQFEFLKKGFWGMTLSQYKLRYCIMQLNINPKNGRRYNKIIGTQRLEELLGKIAPYTSRATKKECPDIPPKIFKDIYVEVTPEQRRIIQSFKKLQEAVVDGKIITIGDGAAFINKARQVLGGGVILVEKDEEEEILSREIVWIDKTPPKMQALLDSIEDHDEQAIVWSVYSHELEMIAEHLSKIGETIIYDGKHVKTREEGKKRFMEGKARFFVGNPAAGAFGLNLQNCHIQYLYNAPTAPIIYNQMIERTNRPGQEFDCMYISIIARSSVDTRVQELIKQGVDIMDAMKRVDIKQLEKIFNGDA